MFDRFNVLLRANLRYFFQSIKNAIKSAIDRGFISTRQAERMLGVSTICSISGIEINDRFINGQLVPLPQFAVASPHSDYGCAIGAIIEKIIFEKKSHGAKVFQLVSAIPREGKSTVAMSIAIAAAAAKMKVLLVDTDVQIPTTSRFFGLRNEQGISNILMGLAESKSVIKYIDDLKFWLICAGNASVHKSIGKSARIDSFIENIREIYDIVLIDSPPISIDADFDQILEVSDRVFFIISGFVPRKNVRRSVLKISDHKNKISGLIFNFIRTEKAEKNKSQI